MWNWTGNLVNLCTPTEVADGSVWSRAKFVIAVAQALAELQDQSQVLSGNNGMFVAVFDGHGCPEASASHFDNTFLNLTEVADKSLLSRAIADHTSGKFFIAVAEAHAKLQDQSQVLSGNNVTFVAVLDGHGYPEASASHFDNTFLNLSGRLQGAQDMLTKDPEAATGSCCLIRVFWKGARHIVLKGDSNTRLGLLEYYSSVPETVSRPIIPANSFVFFGSIGLCVDMSCKDAGKIVNRYSKEGTVQASGQHTSGGKWNNQKSRPKPYEHVRYDKVGSSTSGPSGPETLKNKTKEDQETVIPLLYDDMIMGLQLRMMVRRDLASYAQLAFIGKRLVYGTEEGLRPIDTFYSEEDFGAVEFYWKELSQWDRLVTEWDTVFNVATAFKVEPPNN